MTGLGHLVFLRLIAVCFVGFSASAATGSEAHQKTFELGSYAFANERFDQAAQTFLVLFDQTNSTRVLLEAARATFFAGRYAEARALFEQAYNRSDLPVPIKKNVRQYLAQIEQKTLNWNVSLGLKTDSNPTNFTYHQTVDALGTQLTVVEPVTSRTHTGVMLDLGVNVPLDSQATWILYPSVTAEEYGESTLDRQRYGLALSHSYGAMSQWLTRFAVSNERREVGEESRTLSLRQTLRVGGRPEWQITGYASHQQYLNSERSDVNVFDLGIARLIPFSEKTLARLEAAGGRVRRESEVQTANTARIGLSAFRVVGPVEFSPRVKISRTAFRAADPFFVDRRIDLLTKVGVGLGLANKRYGELRPRIAFSNERVDSTIKYYDYRKWVVDLAFDF